LHNLNQTPALLDSQKEQSDTFARKEPPVTALTLDISQGTAEQLDRIAQMQKRPRATIAAQAIEDFVKREEWQMAEIEAGLEEAKAGKFARPEDVATVLAKYGAVAR
jgi:predicted transcriptional regulator